MGNQSLPPRKKKWYLFQRYLYWNYRNFFVLGRWSKLRFSNSGRLLLILAAITGALGADTTASVTYQVFAVLFILLVSSFLWSLVRRKKIEIQRLNPAIATAKEECHYQVHVSLKTSKPLEGVYILEAGPDPRPKFLEFAKIREPGEENRNWVDRMYSYYRWKWLIEKNKMLDSESPQRFTLFGDRVNVLTIQMIPLKRGMMNLNQVFIGIPDPLGITYSIHWISQPGKMLVMPERISMKDFEFPGAGSPESGVQARGQSGGSEEDFVGLRDYRPGDPMKQIHWASSAKTNKLIVKEYQTTSRSRCGLILDVYCEISRAYEFEKLVIAASSIASRTESEPMDLDFLFVESEAHCFSTGPGSGDLDQMMKILATVQFNPEDSWPSLLKLVEENNDVLQGAVFLTLYWNDERKSLAQYLTLNGIPNLTIVLTDVPEQFQVNHGEDNLNVKFISLENFKSELQSLT